MVSLTVSCPIVLNGTHLDSLLMGIWQQLQQVNEAESEKGTGQSGRWHSSVWCNYSWKAPLNTNLETKSLVWFSLIDCLLKFFFFFF